MTDPQIPEPPPRTLWQRRIRDPIVAQLTQGITPDKIALTVAVGSACGLFPIIGTTGLLCLVAGVKFRLNQPMIQSVNLLCTPIHIPVVLLCVHWGQRLFNAPPVTFNRSFFSELLKEHPVDFLKRFSDVAFHASVVWMIAAPFWIAAVYWMSRPIFAGIARVRAENAAKAVAEKPPEHPIP